MQEDTSKPSADEMGLTLEQLIRRGAKQIVQGAIEAELQELIAQYKFPGTDHNFRDHNFRGQTTV